MTERFWSRAMIPGKEEAKSQSRWRGQGVGMTERPVRRLIRTSAEDTGGEGTGHGQVKVHKETTGRKSPPAW